MGWDKGIDYIYAYNKILSLYKRYMKRKSRLVCNTMVLLIQLRNGSRVSEAVKALKEFVISGKNEVYVEVSKKRKPEKRLMIIPSEITGSRELCVEWIEGDNSLLINRVKSWCIKALGFNTHSLRYAFITHMVKAGVNPALVSKAIHHSKLDQLLTYIQKKASDSILRNLEEIA